MAAILRARDQSTEGGDSAPRAAVFVLSDMASQGDDYVQRVRAEAAKIVQQAHADAAGIRAAAEKKGLADADAQLARLVDQRIGDELTTLRPALDGVVAELSAARGAWLGHWRTAAIGLAIGIAERIVRRELANDPTVSEAWLTEALELAAGASDITVRLAPTDLERLRGHAQRLAEGMSGLAAARFVADDAVSPGGCRVETRHGSIDERLEAQLDRLAEELA